MRAWVAPILLILASTGLLVIILGQNQALMELHKTLEKRNVRSMRLSRAHTQRANVKGTLAKLVAQGTEALDNATAALAAMKAAEEATKAKYKDCQAAKVKIAEEVAALNKRRNETQVAFKLESIAWTQEIDSLKKMLTGSRPICNYVKKDPQALKICGIDPNKALPTIQRGQNINKENLLHSKTPQNV